MNFEQTYITVYDSKNRELDLTKELSPFFQTNESWKNCSITGSYLSCSKYIVMKRILMLGLMCVTYPEETSIMENNFELLLCSGMAIRRGYVFPDNEMRVLKDLSKHTEMIISPELPNTPVYDSIRDQFNSVRSALEIFKT
jgi:hypothetical protein